MLGGKWRRRRQTALAVLASMTAMAAAPAGAENGAQGVAIRDTVLRAAPIAGAEPIARLEEGTALETGERRGLWRAAELADGSSGWVPLTAIRLAPPAAEPGGEAAQAESGSSSSNPFARLSRSVSSLLGGGRDSRVRNERTATIGIRGLTVADLETAEPAPEALEAVSDYRAATEEAVDFAAAGGLRARPLPQAPAQ